MAQHKTAWHPNYALKENKVSKCEKCGYDISFDSAHACNTEGATKPFWSDVDLSFELRKIQKERDHLKSELESLKRERAMLVDALKEIDGWDESLPVRLDSIVTNALSTTGPQATQWLEDKLSAATEELRRKLAEQQAASSKARGVLVMMHNKISGNPSVLNIAHIEYAIECIDNRGTDELTAQLSAAVDRESARLGAIIENHIDDMTRNKVSALLSAAKQEGYEQGKQAGRDEKQTGVERARCGRMGESIY